MEYKIAHTWDDNINNVHHINGGFFSVPNWGVGGELGQFCDTFWNEESLGRVLKSKRAAKAIALAIAEFGETED